MSETTPTNARALREAAARLRRILIVAAVVLVVGEALWCLIGGSRGAVVRPLGTLMCAAGVDEWCCWQRPGGSWTVWSAPA